MFSGKVFQTYTRLLFAQPACDIADGKGISVNSVSNLTPSRHFKSVGVLHPTALLFDDINVVVTVAHAQKSDVCKRDAEIFRQSEISSSIVSTMERCIRNMSDLCMNISNMKIRKLVVGMPDSWCIYQKHLNH